MNSLYKWNRLHFDSLLSNKLCIAGFVRHISQHIPVDMRPQHRREANSVRVMNQQQNCAQIERTDGNWCSTDSQMRFDELITLLNVLQTQHRTPSSRPSRNQKVSSHNSVGSMTSAKLPAILPLLFAVWLEKFERRKTFYCRPVLYNLVLSWLPSL